MSESFTKVLENGFTLTYSPVKGKMYHFLVLEKNPKGQYVQMGEVYNPVVNASNLEFFDPRQTEKREGRWIKFYSYAQGQDPFDFIASKSFYVAGHQEGPYSIFYSPDAKPFSQNLLKEEGKYCDLMGCCASMPKGKVCYWDMQGNVHSCLWKNGKPFCGKVVNGYGSNLTWNETITSYVEGKEQSPRVESLYSRNDPTQAFSLIEKDNEKPVQISHQNNAFSVFQNQSKQR